MPSARWNGQVIAESSDTELVDGDHYFPLESLKQEYFTPSQTTSVCPWKGTASYFHLEVDGQVNTDAAWCYHDPKEAASSIKDRVAFWKGVEVS